MDRRMTPGAPARPLGHIGIMVPIPYEWKIRLNVATQAQIGIPGD